LETGILSGRGLTRRYGGILAVDNFSFDFKRGTATAIIGPNGAGKTSLFNLLSGFESPESGTINFDGISIEAKSPNLISRLGIGRTFQTVRVFHDLTVLENLMLAEMFHTEKSIEQFTDRVREKLSFVDMIGFENTKAKDLSYGQQKLIELAMVLMSMPRLILLDEPVAGVNPMLTRKIGGLLGNLVNKGVTLVIVEHNVPFVSDLCDKILVMTSGRLLMEGSGKTIQEDKRVLEAFLGGI